MKSSYKGFADGALFALNIFILFLLFAGNSLMVPQWLQPVGRMHPLILHFPIVILMLAMLMEFFRFRPEFVNERFYQAFTNYLLVLGVLLSSVTVIMGILLSHELGYEGNNLQWHKWFGVSATFVGYGVYLLRNRDRYTAVISKTGALATVFCLVLAGHFGGNITHGEDYIFAPVLSKERSQIAIDKALIYNDIIAPIFEVKCLSCHNADKMKGGLSLADKASILKGGKKGRLFIAGDPKMSLLLERIHKPEGEKKHMPPTGKPQLTADEKLLLYFWIKNNADFKKKVIDLPVDDSLRMIASNLFKPAESVAQSYDFSAASDADIKKVNNNYRVVYPLANESPALAVNIYNKGTYSAKALEELAPVSKQVVSLNLNKMPVKDADLKAVAKLENLRKLVLNFSDVTGAGLKELTGLKHLQSLSLAGVKLSPEDVKQLSSIKSLTLLAVWDTGLKPADLQPLQRGNKLLKVLTGFKDDGRALKLTNPQLKDAAVVFKQTYPLQLINPIKGAEIRYTIDGTAPDSLHSVLYKPGKVLANSALIRARAFKAGWIGSDTVQFNVYKSLYTPDSILFVQGPDSKYKADGAKTLIDKELGGTGFGNGKWLASQKDMELLMWFNKPVQMHKLELHTMRNIGSQIFLAAEIQVWGGADKGHLKLLANIKPAAPQKNDPFGLVALSCKLKTEKTVSCIKLVARPIKTVPDWHPAKGKPGWIFMDEVFIN